VLRKKISCAGLSSIQPDSSRARAANACERDASCFQARSAMSRHMHRMQASVHAGLRGCACATRQFRLDVYPSAAAIGYMRKAPFDRRGAPAAAIARASFAAKN